MAHGTGPIPNEIQFPCRTRVACLASFQEVMASHQATPSSLYRTCQRGPLRRVIAPLPRVVRARCEYPPLGAGCGRPPFSPRPPLPLGYAPPTLSTNKDTLQWAAACGHLPTPVTSGIPVYSGFLDDPQRAIVDDGRHCAASVCGHFASRFDCVFLGRASRQTHGAWHGTRPYLPGRRSPP